jgi:hypothetical protein
MVRLHGVSSLVDCVKSADPQLAKYASRCIGLLAMSDMCLEMEIKHDCQSLLAERICTSSDEVVREATIALTRMCRNEVIKGQANTKRVMEAMVNEVSVRSAASRVGPSSSSSSSVPKETEDMLAIALKFLAVVSDHPDVRMALLESQIGGTGILQLLVPFLTSEYVQYLKPALVCISNLSTADSVKHELRTLECIPTIVKGVQSKEPTVAAEMLRVLYHLAVLEENRSSITKLGGVLYIVDGLSHQSPSVQHAAVKALQQMTVDAENETVIADAGGLRPLVALLYSDNVDTQRRVLCCLGNLTLTSQNQSLVGDLGGIPTLVSCLQSTDARVKRDAARTLRNLAFVEENKELLWKDETAIPHLLSCLDGDDNEALRYSIRALGVLSVHTGCREVIVACSGVRSMLHALQATDMDTRRSASGALINLSIEDAHKDEVTKLGGLKLILRCLAHTSQDAETARSLLRCISI